MPLQLAARASKAHGVPRLSSSQRLRRAAFRVIDSVNRSRSRRKLKADVLFCPLQYFGRKTENRFLIRTVVGLAQTDATILCLMPHSAPCRQELEQELASMGRKGQVDFVDPLGQTNRVDARIFPRVARMRSEAAFQKAVSILEPAGLAPTPETSWGFDHTATFVEAWERLAQDIEFSAVVTRCHWHTLCSSVCRTAQERGKAAVTFQQGTIGHSLDAPVTASRYVAFGRSSATFLSQMNHVFFEACGLPEPPVSYITAGSFYDTIREMPNQFELKTLLMVDEPITHGEFYGVIGQNRAMLKLAEQLLASEVPLRRMCDPPASILERS